MQEEANQVDPAFAANLFTNDDEIGRKRARGDGSAYRPVICHRNTVEPCCARPLYEPRR